MAEKKMQLLNVLKIILLYASKNVANNLKRNMFKVILHQILVTRDAPGCMEISPGGI